MALEGADDDLEAWIAHTLGRIGPEASRAVPALRRLLEADDWILRASAAQALGRIGPVARNAVPSLARLESDSHPEVRRAAGTALRRLRGELSVWPRDTFSAPLVLDRLALSR